MPGPELPKQIMQRGVQQGGVGENDDSRPEFDLEDQVTLRRKDAGVFDDFLQHP